MHADPCLGGWGTRSLVLAAQRRPVLCPQHPGVAAQRKRHSFANHALATTCTSQDVWHHHAHGRVRLKLHPCRVQGAAELAIWPNDSSDGTRRERPAGGAVAKTFEPCACVLANPSSSGCCQ